MVLFPLLFLISQTSYRTYKIISSNDRSPRNGNHFSSNVLLNNVSKARPMLGEYVGIIVSVNIGVT